MHARRLPALAALLAALAVGACQGNSPLSPSGQAVVLRGTVFEGAGGGGVGASAAGQASSARTSGATITVTLLGNPAVTTTVSADGSFTLRGLPPGEFTLVFYAGGGEIGRLDFGSVLPNQEITIVVDVAGNIVTLLEERRTGIGHGDVEIEGTVDQVLAVNPAGDSLYRISGYTVVARPGQTAIREGNSARTVADVTAGRRVHVKGTWISSSVAAGTAQILAEEILLQGGDSTSVPGGGGSGQACMINGGRAGEGIELEGHVASGGGTSFRLDVNGNRARQPVQVDAGGAVFQCHPSNGPKAVPPAQCQAEVKAGAQVHVSGTLASCDAQAALVRANKIIVQK